VARTDQALGDHTVRDSHTTDVIPGPRTDEPPSGDLPWTTRPRSEYWDHETARWTSRSALPGPRQGD
jgi:hypothetical protein